jgi:predicted dehydrogenase
VRLPAHFIHDAQKSIYPPSTRLTTSPSLPILVQPDYIKRALSAGKHVLAEKPIAKDVATATSLISWVQQNAPSVTFSIAENFRFMDSFVYASQQVASLGRILQFRTRMSAFVKPGGKYYETAWRKVPDYQGGFLLDGGVHFTAATRLLLGADNAPVQTSAYTTQLQPHLPPLDTLDASVKLKSGVTGTFSVSFGTTFTGSEYAVACEGGTVWVSRGKVIVTKDGKEEVKEFKEEGNGVKQEIKAWGEALEKGKVHPRQSPEEALRDLEMVSDHDYRVLDQFQRLTYCRLRRCCRAGRRMVLLLISSTRTISGYTVKPSTYSPRVMCCFGEEGFPE